MISPLARYIILLVTALHLIVLGWIFGLSTPLPWEQTRLLTLTMGSRICIALTILLV